jgi:hypothetical protein
VLREQLWSMSGSAAQQAWREQLVQHPPESSFDSDEPF